MGFRLRPVPPTATVAPGGISSATAAGEERVRTIGPFKPCRSSRDHERWFAAMYANSEAIEAISLIVFGPSGRYHW